MQGNIRHSPSQTHYLVCLTNMGGEFVYDLVIWYIYYSILNTPGSSNQIPASQNNAASNWSNGLFIFLSPQLTAHAQSQIPTSPNQRKYPQHKNTCVRNVVSCFQHTVAIVA